MNGGPGFLSPCSIRMCVAGLAIPVGLMLHGCAQHSVQAEASHPAELARLGDEAYEQRRFEQAQQAYGALTEASPHSFQAWFKLGNTHLRQGQAEQAERAYREALKLDSSDPKAWYNLATARLMSAKGALRGAAENLQQQDPARRLTVQRLRVVNELIFSTLEESAASTDANTATVVEPRS